DREHNPGAEVRVDPAARGAAGQAGRDRLVGRVAQRMQMIQQLVMGHRRVADPEPADDVLLDTSPGEHVPCRSGALRLPVLGLEELSGSAEQRLEPVVRDSDALPFLRGGYGCMVPDRRNRQTAPVMRPAIFAVLALLALAAPGSAAGQAPLPANTSD